MRKELNKLDSAIEIFKKYWLIIVTGLVIITLAAMFIISFIYSEDKEITLNLINSWVSLILGIVATLLSIISMFLSFYNLERANEMNENSLESMKELQKNVEATLAKIIELEKVVGKASLGAQVEYDTLEKNELNTGFVSRERK